MDREQEDLQFLSFFGIFKESIKIIISYPKIFTQITLALILPLCFIFLAHIQITELLFFDILSNEDSLDFSPQHARLISSEWTAFWLFKAAYFTFSLILSLLSTSAVVYTIACIYTAKQITFRRVIRIVPKVWKRLMVTFIWSFGIVLVYNIVFGGIFYLWAIIWGFHRIGIGIFVLLVIFYLMGFVYASVVWHLASVVSVLEDSYGFQAMIKSMGLIKGKMKVSVSIFLTFSVVFIGGQLIFELFVVPGSIRIIVLRFGIGVICFLLIFMVFLFGLIAQTIIYFVCKSFHHENIDKSLLADHLEVYLGEYVPLQAKDVQLEEFHF